MRDSLKIKFNQALGYHLEVPIRHKAKMNEILADGISNHIEGQQDSVMAVQPTRAALRYKTDEIIALEKEVSIDISLSSFSFPFLLHIIFQILKGQSILQTLPDHLYVILFYACIHGY